MELNEFLNKNNYPLDIVEIIKNIVDGSIEMYQKLNEETVDVFGTTGEKNIQNEEVQKLDLIANAIFIEKFKKNRSIYEVLSEENEHIINLNKDGNYLVAMDPLDGSSNIDVNIPVGSIFSILENNKNGFLQKGEKQKMACYVIYGTTTMMVFAFNNEVNGFTLNTKKKQFILTHKKITTPENGSIFSINEGNYNSMDRKFREFIIFLKKLNEKGGRTHTGRFIGSLIADFHRNMLKGGIFIYPQTNDRPNGQLRLIYECNPIAFIAAVSGAEATNLNENILSIKPKSLHERTSFIVGSKNMVKKLLSITSRE